MCGDSLLKAYKCVVELAINEVSAPGVRLANKEDLYVNVCLLGQQRRTRLVPAVFPLKFYDNLVFEKTFRFCSSPCDIMDFLADLHVLIELIQLGRSAKNEVIACYETNVRDFLYPSSCCCPTYHSAQRDLFLHKAVGFPGQISPQLIFCTFTSVCETQTPSLDILREHESRLVPDPLIELKKEDALRRKLVKDQLRFGNSQSPRRGIPRLDLNSNVAEFASHTISSAIKADYTQPQVKAKISELKPSVQKVKIVRDSRGARAYKPKSALSSHQRRTPFVVRHVDQNLIARKTELHDMLHDGLVLTNKNPKKIYGYKRRQRPASASWRDVEPYGTRYGENSVTHFDQRPRLTRSLSPSSPRSLFLERPYSLNESLNEANYRPIYHDSRSRSRTNSPYLRSANGSPSNCDVCYDSELRKALPLSRSNSNSSVLFGRSRSPNRDRLNETQILRSQVLSNSTKKVKKCKKGSKKGVLKSKSPSKFPTSHHPSNPGCEINWRYTRYYPWLYNYSSYLRDLDEELYWLRVRSRYMSSC